MSNYKKFLRDKDVAERYGTNRTTVWRWVKTFLSAPCVPVARLLKVAHRRLGSLGTLESISCRLIRSVVLGLKSRRPSVPLETPGRVKGET